MKKLKKRVNGQICLRKDHKNRMTSTSLFRSSLPSNRIDFFKRAEEANNSALSSLSPQIIQELLRLVASYHPTTTLSTALPIHYIAMRGDVEKLQQVENLSLLESKDEKGLTPLHYAILAKEKGAISHLLEKNNLAYQTPDENSYLHYAALSGDEEILALFLNKNLDPSLRNRDLLSVAHLWALASNNPTELEKLNPNSKEEPLQFTALDLFMIKQLGANQILSKHEWQLFRTNLADLSVVGLSFYLTQMKTSNLFTSGLAFLHHTLGIFKAVSIQQLASCQQDTQVANPMQALQLKGMGWLSGFKGFFFAQAGASTTVVVKRMLSHFHQTSNESQIKTLAARFIRLFNTGSAFFDTYLSLNYPSYPHSCSILTEDKRDALQNMTFQERLNHFPELAKNQDCIDAKLALLDPNATKSDCTILKRIYRRTALATHPDKAGGDKTTFDALGQIYNTLCPKK